MSTDMIINGIKDINWKTDRDKKVDKLTPIRCS